MNHNPTTEGLQKVLNAYLDTKEQLEMKIQKIRSAIEVLESDEAFLRQLHTLAERNLEALIQSPVDPLYPLNAKIQEKMEYFNEYNGRFWTANQFKSFITSVEGDKAEKTLKNLTQKTYQLLNSRELIMVKYGGSNKYTFYTTNDEWVEFQEWEGKKVCNIKSGFEPDKEMLENLTPKQKSPLNMRWKGVI